MTRNTFKIFFVLISLCASLWARYERDTGKEVVIDSKTNLIWQDNERVSENNQDWWNALEYCNDLTLGNYDDWRLPNIRELLSITDKSKFDPAMHSAFKWFRSSYYWSATTRASNSSNAWNVGFYNGYDGNGDKSNSNYVRCVRQE